MTDRTLFVASTGGHLTQLVQLAPRIEPDPRLRVWATFDTPQSRSMLADEGQVEFVKFMAPRQWRVALRNTTAAWRILGTHKPKAVVSTGSGIALSFLPLARARGARTMYIESAARTEGPSVTGRILSTVPGIRTFSQYRHWSSRRWPLGYSVFDQYDARVADRSDAPVSAPRILVQLGTLDFPFERLVRQVMEALPPDAEVVWQLGKTPAPDGLPGRVFDFAPVDELNRSAQNATAVICHAGCGSAITALENGVWPILVPRASQRGEHIDDHQRQIARELADRGLAIAADVDDVDTGLLSRDYRISAASIQ